MGYVNVIQQKAKRWNDKGGVDKFDVPDYSKDNLSICRDALVEAVAETSEEFMNRYFDGDEFSEDEIRSALRVNVLDGSIVPVLMGDIISISQARINVPVLEFIPQPTKYLKQIMILQKQNLRIFLKQLLTLILESIPWLR